MGKEWQSRFLKPSPLLRLESRFIGLLLLRHHPPHNQMRPKRPRHPFPNLLNLDGSQKDLLTSSLFGFGELVPRLRTKGVMVATP